MLQLVPENVPEMTHQLTVVATGHVQGVVPDSFVGFSAGYFAASGVNIACFDFADIGHGVIQMAHNTNNLRISLRSHFRNKGTTA